MRFPIFCYLCAIITISKMILRLQVLVCLFSVLLDRTMCENSEQKGMEDFKLTVVVLTMNRPNSLARLLKSLAATDLEDPEKDKFDVEIHIDKAVGSPYEDCVKLARNFTMPHVGKVTPVLAEKNRGLRAAWFEAWYPKPDDEYVVIVEDDLELSPMWHTWLKKAWAKYKDRADLAGINLSRQHMMVKKPDGDVEIINEYRPFLYKLVGTWAFSPHPKRWREFLDWFHSVDSDSFDPFVPGLATSDWLHQHTAMGKRHMTWEQWHIYHSEKEAKATPGGEGLFTLYLNLPRRLTLVANWREHGVHTRGSFNERDYPLLEYCAIELQDFPEDLRRYGWDALEILAEGETPSMSFEFNSGTHAHAREGKVLRDREF